MTLREFELTFKRLYVPLGMYALRIVDDIDDAEDIVQEAFVGVWEQIQRGKDVGNIKSYLYMSVRNKALSFMRDKRAVFIVDDCVAQEVTEEDIDTSERDAAIWKAIDGLPEKCREVFLMSKRDGMSNEEIAAELGISIKTVKNQMTKAYSRLRDALSDGHKPFFLPFL